MKRFAVVLAIAALLASCAPSATGPVAGRIVNGKTGEEGQVAFTRGTLRPRLNAAQAPDSVTIAIGGQTYSGRTVVVDGGSVRTAPGNWAGNWDMSFGFGGSRNVNDNFFGWGSRVGRSQEATLARTGNLIARTTTAPTRTLTCTLTVDVYEHGVGDCTDGEGTRYALQF